MRLLRLVMVTNCNDVINYKTKNVAVVRNSKLFHMERLNYTQNNEFVIFLINAT